MTEKHILVIDDENSVRKIVCDNLRLSGFRVSTASDGNEGLGMIDAAAPPDLVITDMIMPNRSGLDVISEIRRAHPSIRLIAISGGGRLEAVNDLLEKARETGADAALSKPLDLDELERIIEELLK